MPLYFLITFGLFAGSVLALIGLWYRVRHLLIRRHPKVWRDLMPGRGPVGRFFNERSALWGFVIRRDDTALGDPRLSAAVKSLWLSFAAALGAWLAAVVAFLIGTDTMWPGSLVDQAR